MFSGAPSAGTSRWARAIHFYQAEQRVQMRRCAGHKRIKTLGIVCLFYCARRG